MIVAMVAVRMMEPALDEIVGVIAMRHGGMTAVRAVNVPGVMTRVPVLRRALVRVPVADLDRVLVNAVAVRAVQMAVMQIVDVVAVLDADMPAPGTMMMGMFFRVEMRTAGHSSFLSFG